MNKDVTNNRSGERIDSEHARIVAEVLEDQARRRAVREAADVSRAEESDKSFFLQVGLLVAGTFFFYLLFFSPAWVAPTASDPISVQATEDGLRVAIYTTASQIQEFRSQQGRLPRSMEELSVSREGVTYERVDAETFVVLATTGGTTLRYVSTEPLDEFVGNAWSRVLGDAGSTS